MANPLHVVIFGASGDLTARKLVPALFQLFRKRRLPESTRIVGNSRRPMSHDALRELLAAMARKVMADFDEAAWSDFARRIEYVAADASTRVGLQPLFDWFAAADNNQPADRLYYLSVKPELYEPIAAILGETGLSREEYRGPFRRIIVEKPFGRDEESADRLNATLHAHFDPGQVYRIDHYLGKETVQNILALRFGNTLFEPLWHRDYVDHVQITAAEAVTVGERGDFYDESGVLRDMFQSHLLQVLAVTLLEAPPCWSADDLRNAKKNLLDAVRIYSPAEVSRHIVLGQYAGYRSEPKVNPQSHTPTFAALRLFVDNDRWRDVPMYLRSGKGMKARVSEVVIQFKRPERVPLDRCEPPSANWLTIRIQPKEGIRISFQVKQPDTLDGTHLHESELAFSYEQEFGRESLPEAYERLILDAIHGDAALFLRSDTIERAWEIMDPIIAATAKVQPVEYPCGSWGPLESDTLLQSSKDHWRNPEDAR